MALNTIPEEVLRSDTLPLLEWNDLLRLRRVSKHFDNIVTSYMRTYPELAPEIEINEEEKPLDEFLKMDIPTTKLYVNNFSGYEFFQKNDRHMSKFFEKYGRVVKQLRMFELGAYTYGKEWDFLDGFGKLESLQANRFGLGTKNKRLSEKELYRLMNETATKARNDPRYFYANPPIPESLRSLRCLKIGQDDIIRFSCISNRHEGFLGFCKKLEYLELPLGLHWQTRDDTVLPEALSLAFSIITKFLNEGRASCLKTIDFFSYYNFMKKEFSELEIRAADMFPSRLLDAAWKHNIKLLNTRAPWFRNCASYPRKLGRIVGSLINILPGTFFLDMSNLERIQITATSLCSVGTYWKEERPNWPALKTLDITVDSKLDANVLFRFLFEDISRLAVTELRLNFVKDKEEVAIPKIDDIVASCPNLKKLTFVNWPGTNKWLISLWEGCPGLEEITLENCKNVGNVTFVGVDTQNPVFFKLKKLRKLTLRDADQMPKITDLLFSLVIRHLNLKHFVITSKQPLETVTAVGISALLDGRFAQCIEKFPLRGWSLKDISSEQFQALEKKFRSFDMI